MKFDMWLGGSCRYGVSRPTLFFHFWQVKIMVLSLSPKVVVGVKSSRQGTSDRCQLAKLTLLSQSSLNLTEGKLGHQSTSPLLKSLKVFT